MRHKTSTREDKDRLERSSNIKKEEKNLQSQRVEKNDKGFKTEKLSGNRANTFYQRLPDEHYTMTFPFSGKTLVIFY